MTFIKDHDPLYLEPIPGRTIKIREVQAEDGARFMFGVEIWPDGTLTVLTPPHLSCGKGRHYVSLGLSLTFQTTEDAQSPSDLSKQLRRILRYSFLCGYAARNDAEEAEVQELQKDLEAQTGWPVVPRLAEEPDLDTFQGSRSAPKLPPGRLP